MSSAPTPPAAPSDDVRLDYYEDDFGDGELPFCSVCQNTGWMDCGCGGDTCCCENNGNAPCDQCERGFDAY